MPRIEDKRTFEGGMNLDKDPRALAPNEYGYAINFKNNATGEGTVGVLTNLRGNVELFTSGYNIQPDVAKSIGSFYDDRRQRTYFFVFQSEYSRIFYYDAVRNEVKEVIGPKLLKDGNEMTTEILGFGELDKIVSADVYHSDSFGDTLIFTNNRNEIRKINVRSAINTLESFQGVFDPTIEYATGEVVSYEPQGFLGNGPFFYRKNQEVGTPPIFDTGNPETDPSDTATAWTLLNPGAVYPYPFSEAAFCLMPDAPPLEPSFDYFDDQFLSDNFIGNKQFQFICKYVYFDGQESHWSSVSESDILGFGADEYNSTSIGSKQNVYNSLNVRIPVTRRNNVSSVRIAVREGGDKSAPEDFYQVAEVEVQDFDRTFDGDFMIYRFTNQETKIPIDINDIDQVFYRVPKTCRSLRIISDKLLMGSVEDGYNLPSNRNLDVEISQNHQDRVFPETISESEWINDNSESITEETVINPNFWTTGVIDVSSFWVDIPSTIEPGDTVYIELQVAADADGFATPGNTATTSDDRWPVTGYSTFILEHTVQLGQDEDDVAQILADKFNGPGYFIVFQESDGQTGPGFKPLNASWSSNRITFNLNPPNPVNTPFGGVSSFYDMGGKWAIFRVKDISVKKGVSVSRTFKYGQKEYFGFVYEDKFGRVSNVLRDESCETTIEPKTVSNPPVIQDFEQGPVSLDMEIKHNPPSWAVKWKLVKQIRPEYYLQFPLSRGNCESGSWNFDDTWVRGYLDLSLETPNLEPAGPNGEEFLYISLNAVSGLNSAFNVVVNNSILSYEHVPGDRLRFVTQNGLESDYDFNGAEIISYSPSLNTVAIKASDIPPLLESFFSGTNGGASTILVEIYRPILSQEELEARKFYEYKTFDIVDSSGNPVSDDFSGSRFHGGDIQNQNGASDNCIVRVEGEHFYKPRSFSIGGGTGSVRTFMVFDRNYFDTIKSSYSFFGRPAAYFEAEFREGGFNRSFRSVRRPATIMYSEKSIPQTSVINLGTVYYQNQRDADFSSGDISFIKSEGDSVIIFQRNRIGRAFVDRRIVSGIAGDADIIAQGNVPSPVSEVKYYEGEYGVPTFEESITWNGGRVYFFDDVRGVYCRLSQNGITPISIKGVDNYIGQKGREFTLEKTSKVVATYNKNDDEVCIMFTKQNPVPLVEPSYPSVTIDLSEIEIEFPVSPGEVMKIYTQDGNSYDYVLLSNNPGVSALLVPATSSRPTEEQYNNGIYIPGQNTSTDFIVFSERLNAWTSFTDHEPDWMEKTADTWVSFKNSAVFLEESQSAQWGVLYEQPTTPLIDVPSNKGPDIVKFWTNIELKTNEIRDGLYGNTIKGQWKTAEDGIRTSEEQISQLDYGNFKFKEAHIHAAFLMDKNSLGGLYDGNVLRGSWMMCRLELDQERSFSSEPSKLFAVTFLARVSNYSK